MAEAEAEDPFQTAIDNELKCPLCLSRFRMPKDLDCPHVYCKECLENLRKSTGGGKTIDCPECRLITVIPLKGIDGLKTNLRLRNMVEAAEKQEKVKRQKSLTRRPVVPECGEHEGEKLHLYCETDDYLICHVCAVVDHPHPKHRCRNVKEVVDEQKDRDAGNLCKAYTKLDELKEEWDEIFKTEKVLTEFMAAEEADILRCVRAIQKAAQQRGTAMINLMRQMHEDHINDLQEARNQIDVMTKKLETVVEAVRVNMNTATDYEYVAQHQTLYSNMTSQIQQKIPKSVDRNYPRIKFVSNKGSETMVNLGHLQTSKVKDINAQLCGRLALGSTSHMSETDQIKDIAALSDGSLALVFDSRVAIYKTTEYENVDEELEKYSLQLCLEPPVGYKDKPCWVGSSFDTTSITGTWLTHGVAIVDEKFAVMDGTPFVKIFSSSGKFQKMFTTMNYQQPSKLHKQSSIEKKDGEVTPLDDPKADVSYTCITQDVDGKTIFLGDLARKAITTHDSTGKRLSTFSLEDPPYRMNIFGQRIAVTTIADRIDFLDKVTGEKIISIDVPIATGACVDIKSGCMFVTTADYDSFEPENGKLEAYCSMTGKYMRCLVPVLSEPCGAMTLIPEERLAVVDKQGVNLYHIVYAYQ